MPNDTAYIYLSQGQRALVDAADYDMLNARKWHASLNRRGSFYAAGSERTNGKQKTVYMHRVIMGAPVGLVIDHINHDPLDNRRCNLRICTNAENTRNTSSTKNKTSKYLGVNWDKRRSKWQAWIRVGGKNKNLGAFTDELSAANAYDVAARTHFGEFANPNFR